MSWKLEKKTDGSFTLPKRAERRSHHCADYAESEIFFSLTGYHEVTESDRKTLTNEVPSLVQAVMTRRKQACPGRYPFEQLAGQQNWKLVRKGSRTDDNKDRTWSEIIYLFLLLCTRLDMGKNREFANLDGAQLFEHLCVVAVQGYLGERCEAKVIGAREFENNSVVVNKGRFYTGLNNLCDWLNNELNLEHMQKCCTRAQEEVKKLQSHGDGGIDVAAKITFRDLPVSHMSLWFVQCKTGMSYKPEDAMALVPERFVLKFMVRWIDVLPSSIGRMFMIADHPEPKKLKDVQLCGCTLLHRLRILDCLNEAVYTRAPGIGGENLHVQISQWVKAATAPRKKVTPPFAPVKIAK